MPAAILLIVLGSTLAYSAFKGIGITDVFGGIMGDSLDPHGAKPSTTDSSATGTTAGLGTLGLVPKAWCTRIGGIPCVDFATANGPVLDSLANAATKQFNLTITATTNGVHTGGSKHYLKRAFDAAGSPADMAAYYDYAHGIIMNLPDGELFYDPKGGVDSGHEIGAIGGHGDHVHTGI